MFSIQLKPIGSACNLSCEYCYVQPFRDKPFQVMSPAVMEKVAASCLASNPEPTFSWHGGEPTLAGLDFFRHAVDVMQRHAAPGHRVRNILQTNATLVTPEFARFLQENEFGVSVSVDGTREVHGFHRCDCRGQNTYDQVMRGVQLIREAGVDPSVICTVTRQTMMYPRESFRALIKAGFTRLKFNPVYDAGNEAFNISSEEWYT